jgi:hypothetical protein
MKEVFITINKDNVSWIGPETSGSEPYTFDPSCSIGVVVDFVTSLAKSRNEEWTLRFERKDI